MSNKTASKQTIPAEFKKPETFRVAPISEYGCFEDYLADTEKLYEEKREAFLAGDVNSDTLPELSDSFADASRLFIMAAAALYNKYRDNADKIERALGIFDRCKKDSGIREKNLMLHYELMKKQKPDEPKTLDKIYHKVLDSLQFLFRAQNTQLMYLRRYLTGPVFMSPEYKMDLEGGPRAKAFFDRVPRGHHFWPARPFYPVCIPEGMRVPPTPPVYAEWKSLPVEDYVFDTEHDEFVLPKGYVSPDGRIDDQSVVWDWENRTVSMKYVGEEPVVWPFWKARDSTDLPEGWAAEYNQRFYWQVIEDQMPPGWDDP